MKNTIITIILFTSTFITKAQVGPAIRFDYDGSGYRTKRFYDPTAQLNKPGRDTHGNQADTLLFSFSNFNSEKNFKDTLIVKEYPNPVHEILFVENMTWKDGNNVVVILSDASGKELKNVNGSIAKLSVNTNDLVPGNYFLKYFINNIYVYSWKIVKL